MNSRLYTIGYSPFSTAGFIDVLRRYAISSVCDVRSAPYSRYKPEFNRTVLEEVLASHEIGYLFLGGMLGGRPTDPELYEDGKVRFERVARSRMFVEGLERLRETARDHTAVLMCAEKDPVVCHRMILVCRQLRCEFDIVHILEDGCVEAHRDAERRLVKLLHIPTDDLFRAEDELIESAYEVQGEKIGYVRRERE